MARQECELEVASCIEEEALFERRPFWDCPSCGSQSSLGVLDVDSSEYARRCIKCRHYERFPLPPIKKHVIYLDQMVISNIAKALIDRVDNQWLAVFRKLHRLVNAQLVICPDSDIHFVESSVSAMYKPFQRIYKHLSGGVGFYDADTVVRFQYCVALDEFARTKLAGRPPLSLADITHGDPNGWQDVIMVIPNTQLSEGDLEAVRNDRDRLADDFREIFLRWQNENRTFEEYFRLESSSAGPGILLAREIHKQRIIEAVRDGSAVRVILSPPPGENIYSSLRDRLEDVDPTAWRVAAVDDFLRSDVIPTIPGVKISSCLYAVLARQANQGRKKPPTRGFANDIKAISAFLPYVDAMFLDNEMRNFLSEKDVRERLGHRSAIFSTANIGEFERYLDSITTAAPNAHWEKLAEVYGESFSSDFDTILDEYVTS